MTNTELASKPPLSIHQRGLLLALSCYVLWCMGDAAIKAVALEGVPPLEIIALYSWITSIIFVSVTAARGRLAALRPVNLRMTVIRGLLIVVTIALNIVAFAHVSMALFYAIIFLSPFLVALGARLFLREALSWKVGVVILGGFTGMVIAVNPVEIFSGKGETIGILAVMGAATCFSGSQLMLRHMSRTETPENLVFSAVLISAIITTAPAFMMFQAISFQALMFLVLAGAINIAANLSMAVALRATAAANVASLHYSQIIPGAIFGYLLWNEIPAWSVWAGSAVIIAAGLAMARLANGKAT